MSVFADNITYFARTLRRAGLPVGPASVLDALSAVDAAGIRSKEDFYWTLHTVFVKRRDQHEIFDQAFELFFRKRELIEKMLQILSPVTAGKEKEPDKPKAGANRVNEALFVEDDKREKDVVPELELDARLSMSSNDVLRGKDFAQMSAAEIAEAKRQISLLRLPADKIKTRRMKPSSKPVAPDMRRTLSQSMRSGGELLMPAFKARREIAPPVVVLADISGSMSQYSRIFLHFLHALTEKNRRVHTFLFGTRLTNVTRQLRLKDPDEALAGCSESVFDWSGGTRIGSTLRSFNRDWSRRVLGQGAVVLLITDGLDREVDDKLGDEMARLHRSCRRLIWLNPLLRFDGFQARASGIRAMLPHVDEFRTIHSVDSMADLCDALSIAHDKRHDPKRWLRAA